MGLFKGMRDIKALVDEHGGMPTLRGSFKDIAAVADDRGEREVLKVGIPARAIVQGFPQPVPGDRFALRIPLEVHVDGREPYAVDYVFTAARMQAALTAGMEVPVKVHPEEPQRVAVQWDAQQAAIAAAGGTEAATQAAFQRSFSSQADDAYRAARAARESAAPDVRLKELQEMRAAGLITDEELARKRAAVLAAM